MSDIFLPSTLAARVVMNVSSFLKVLDSRNVPICLGSPMRFVGGMNAWDEKSENGGYGS